jgi:hypothetical protein
MEKRMPPVNFFDRSTMLDLGALRRGRVKPMKFVIRVAGWSLVMLMAIATAAPAAAETKLTDFDGHWQGAGTDRYTPLQATQRTRCSATIAANATRMNSQIDCNGVAGLTKVIQLSITLAGDAFSGHLTQKATTRGDESSASVLNGTVAGHKTDQSANFKVSFSGLTPSVDVTLTLLDSSSFSMRAATFGGQLMDVTFRRSSKP